jgi:hypothetical protein
MPPTPGQGFAVIVFELSNPHWGVKSHATKEQAASDDVVRRRANYGLTPFAFRTPDWFYCYENGY